MPDKNYKYTIGLDVDAKTLKMAIKNDVRDALKECDKIGDALAKGLSPDTSGLEGRLSRLETYMEKLHEATNGTKDEFTHMKKAFEDLTVLQARLNNLESGFGEIKASLTESTQAIQQFISAFTVNKPEQAIEALTKAFQRTGDVGGSAAAGMQKMKNAAEAAADATKKNFHEVETEITGTFNAATGVIETAGRAANNMSKDVQKAAKELERLDGIRKSYGADKEYKSDWEINSLKDTILKDAEAFEDLKYELDELSPSADNYNEKLLEVLESGHKLLALTDRLSSALGKDKANSWFAKESIDGIDVDVNELRNKLNNAFSTSSAEVSKVKLKPLKLEVDIANDGKLLEQVNKQIDKLNENSGLHKIEIETLFVDPVDKADVDLNDENIESDKTYQKIEKSLKKQIKRVNTAFEKETKDLTDKISEFKKNIDDSLELKFNWQKGNNATEIQTLFDLVQELSYNNPIILHPDTNDFINKIDEALKNHEFTLKLDNSDVALNAKIVGGVPITGSRSGGGPLTPKRSNKPSQPAAQQQPSRAPDASPASAEEKRQTKVVDNNSEAVVDNTAAINAVVGAFKSWVNGINRGLGSGKQTSIDNAMAKKHAMKSILWFDPTELNDQQLEKKVVDLLKNTTIADTFATARTNVPELKSRGINLVSDKFLEKFVGAQDALGVQRSTHQAETVKHSHKEYYEFAKNIVQMGASLKRSFVTEGVIPGAKSLEQVGELFKGTSYEELSKSAYKYADAIQKVSEEFADGGNLYEFMQSLETKRNAAQGVLDSKNATKKERNAATKTIGEVDSIKSQIIEKLKPFGENYEAQRKQVAGLIASISKGFKFTLTLKGENGKEDYKLSFNDKTAEADYHVQYYGEMLGRMNKIDWDNDVVASEFSSTINNAPLHLVYDDVMSRNDAVSSIVSQYNALDDKTKLFFNGFITDLDTFLDETASAGKRWKVIEESFFSWQSKGGKQVLGINTKLNEKYKRTQDKEDSKSLVGQFLNILEESMFVYSASRVSAAQQRQMSRGVDKGTGVYEAKKNVPASERKYGYTSSDRAYRTEYSGETKTIEEYESELADVNSELSKSNAQLEQAKSNLEDIRQKRNDAYKKELEESGLSQEQRNKLQEQYPNIKSQEDFDSAYKDAKKKYEDSEKKASDLQSKISAESKRIDDLDAKIQSNSDFIFAAQTRIDNVKNAGDVEQYINQLNQQIKSSEDRANALRAEANQRNKTERQILEYAFKKGEIDENTYNQQKNEIDNYIQENERLVRSEQDKYFTLKKLRDDFLTSGAKDKNGNYLSVEEYEKNQRTDIQTTTTSSNQLLSERLASTKNLESLQSEAQQTANESSVAYAELYNLEVAFNEEYQKYVNQQLDTTKKNLEAAKLVQKDAKTNVANAQQAYDSKKTAIGLEEDLIAKATTEDNKKKHIETKEKLESDMADADKVLQEAKQKQDEIDRSVESLRNKISFLSHEVDNANKLRNPNIATEFDRELQEAQSRYNTEAEAIKKIENDKSILEDKIRRLKEGRNIAETPIAKMTGSQKETAVRKEVEAINEDLKIAEDRIGEAKDRKEKIDAELKYLSDSKHKTSWQMRKKIDANYALAERDLANNSEYQKFIQELNQQIGLDRETKRAKRREWVADWIDKNDTTGKYKVTKEGYVSDLKVAQKTQEGLIKAAEEYQGELVKHKEAALAILGVTEEELFAKKEITKEVQQQNSDTSSSTSTTTTTPVQESREVERRVEKQSSNVDQAFIDAIDVRLDENDAKIKELQAQVNAGASGVSANTKEKFKKYGVDLNTHFVTSIADKHNKDFYSTLKKEKGSNLFDASDVDNINAIIKKARELRAELASLEKDGKQGSTKSIMLQRQLSKLLDVTKKRISATPLADGYEKNKANKDGYAQMSQKGWTKFLTDRVAGDLAGFVGSKFDIKDDGKLHKVLLSTIDSAVSKYPEQFQQIAVKAYEDAFNSKKNSLKGTKLKSGEIERRAKEAGLKVLEDCLMEFNYGTKDSIQEYDTTSVNDEAKAELTRKIAEINTENEELRRLREHYIKGMLDDDDTGTLSEFIDKKTLDGIIYSADMDARNSIDRTGKTKEQFDAEVRALSEKIITEMILSMFNNTREGIHDAVDNYDDAPPTSDDGVSGEYGYYSDGDFVQADGIVIQASKVVVNGNTVGTSGDGSGKWALETTLGETNKILNGISGKIDAIKSGSASGDDSSIDGGTKKKKKPEIDVNTAKATLYQAADENIATSFGEGTKSVRKFNADTLKLYETLTLANGETVKFTYSINKMDGSVKSSYTTVANFEKVAKQAYAELGKNNIATKQMFDGLNFPEEKVTAYSNAITALDNKLNSLGSKGVTDPSDAAEVEVLTNNVKKARTELEGMAKASAKLANEHDLVKAFGSDDIDNIKEQMKALAQETNKGAVTFNNFNEETNELTFSVKNSKNELTTLTYKFDELTNSVYKTGQASKTTTGFFRSFFSDVGAKIGQLARYYTGMSLLTEAFQRVRQGVQYVRDIDLALTELKKVTDETESSYHKFLQTMSDTAGVVGSTVSELTNSAAAWARLGFSMEEAGELAKNTAILLNVSEFESEEQATEALISSLQAFNYEAEDSIKIVDKLNIVGNNFAISSNGIAEGLSRSASTLVAAGNSLEQSIAMLAAGNKVQQDPEALGNALKVLSMRIRGTKTDLEEAGEETDGFIENTSKLQAKVMALTNVDGKGGVNILTDTGAYKSTYQILLEIAEVWDKLNEYDPKAQAALLEILAGKTRGSQVASILQNPEDLRDAYEMALNSDGSAQQELETYLSSIQGRIDLFTNELQTFWMNLINSNVIKLVVDAGTTILSVLNNIMASIDKFAEGWGSLGVIVPGILMGIGTHIFKAKNDIKDMSGMIDFVGKHISNFFKSGKSLYDAYTDNFGNAMNALSLQAQGATTSMLGATKAGQAMNASWSALTATIGTTAATILGIVAVLGIAAAVYDGVTTSHKEWVDKLEQSTKELEEIQSEIKSLNDEFKDTERLIEELENKGALSFTEEEELSRLKAQNAELDRTIKLQKILEQRKQKEQVETAFEAMKTDTNLQEQYVDDYGATGYGANSSYQSVGNQWDINLNALQSAKEEYDKAKSEYDTTVAAAENDETITDEEIAQLKKNLDKKEKVLNDANSRIDKLKTDWDSKYGDIEYFESTDGEKLEDWQKEFNEEYRTIHEHLNQQAFINGKFGKADVLSYTFGIYATDAAQAFKDNFEAGIKEGKNPTDIINEILTNEQYGAIFDELSAYSIDFNDIIGFFTKTGEYAEQASDKITTTVTSLDALTASVEAYKAAQEVVNSITSDGQAISEDYYNTLKEQIADATIAEQGFSDAIEEQNGKYIVKNVSLLNKLVAQSKNAQKSTIQMAKAQAQLQYKNLVQQMRNTIIYMGAQAGAYGIMSQAVEENIWMMEDQLETLKQTIQQYALLELSLSKAGNSFDEYEKAKERDAQLTYDDSMLEMLKTIDEGLLKNETGTEAFEYAVKAIVPEKFWKDIDDVDEKIRSIHDYIDGDNVFSKFFYVDEESGDLDITTDNVREFVDLCTESGLFDGSSKDFALSDSVEGIEDFANALGVTEPVILAMLTALEKVDAKWGNILTEVTMNPFDRKVYSTTQTMAELNSKFADGTITAEEYAKQMADAETKLDEYTKTAKARLLGSDNGTPETSDDTVGFIEKNKQVAAAQEEVNKATDELVKKQKEYNQAVEDGVKGEDLKPYEDAVNQATVKVNEHTSAWSKLVEERGKFPTEYEIELVVADIDKELETYGNNFNQALKDNFHLDDNGYYVINTDVNIEELEKSIPGIKKYIELLNSKTEIKTYADTSAAEEDANKLKATVDGVIAAIEENLITLELNEDAVNNIVEQANKILSGIAQTLGVNIVASMPSWMKSILKFMGFNVDGGEKTPVVSDVSKAPSSSAISGSRDNSAYYSKYKRGNSVFATGSDGLKASEHNAVVGELGPEMVVDPVRGVYYTVGENGTEMVDLPKGAIIYNHKQTEELLKNGYTSRGSYTGGLSFANGNAHSGISHGVPSYHPNREDKTSYDNYTRVNTKWDDATSTLLDAADALSDASSNASDAFEDAINWIDVLFTRIENNISEQEAYLETIVDSTGGTSLKDSVYSSIFGQLYSKANASLASRDYYAAKAEAEMVGLPADIQNKIRNGAISIQDFKGTGAEESDEALQKYVDQINKAIEYYDKISEYEQQYWTTLTEIADKAVEHQQEVATAYENEIGLVEHLNNSLEARNDLEEAREGFATKAYYSAQIDAQEIILGQLEDQRDALQGVLDEEVRLGNVKIGDQQWFDMQQAIYDVDDAIIDTEASIEDLQNSINDLHWARFDELINRFEYLEEEIGNVVQLLSHDPDGLVMEELRDLTSGDWASDSGLATIGLYAQEMERAQYVANEYADAIKDLKKQYAQGRYNETEYLNKLNELTSSQMESIEKYYDARDAIVELNEARVDAIREGIEKEIDAYDELIQKKKELLDKEQD